MTDHANTAIISLDLENDLVHPDGKLAAAGFAAEVERRGVLGRAAKVLAAGRSANLPISHVRVGFRSDYADIHSRSKRFEGIRKNAALQADGWGTQMHETVTPEAGEVIFTKQSVNPFLTTGLLSWLVRRSIEEIVIFGVSTNQVVEATARHADDIGLLVTVLEDCCASGNDEMHRFAAEKILPIFSSVTTADEFLGRL